MPSEVIPCGWSQGKGVGKLLCPGSYINLQFLSCQLGKTQTFEAGRKGLVGARPLLEEPGRASIKRWEVCCGRETNRPACERALIFQPCIINPHNELKWAAQDACPLKASSFIPPRQPGLVFNMFLFIKMVSKLFFSWLFVTLGKSIF